MAAQLMPSLLSWFNKEKLNANGDLEGQGICTTCAMSSVLRDESAGCARLIDTLADRRHTEMEQFPLSPDEVFAEHQANENVSSKSMICAVCGRQRLRLEILTHDQNGKTCATTELRQRIAQWCCSHPRHPGTALLEKSLGSVLAAGFEKRH